MMRTISEGYLPWLPPQPETVRAIIRGLSDLSADGQLDALAALTRTDLDSNHIAKVDTRLRALQDAARPLARFRLAILATGTFDFTVPALRVAAFRHGVRLETYLPGYGQTAAEVLNPNSGLHAFQADGVLLAETAAGLGLAAPIVDPGEADAAVERAAQSVAALVERLQAAGVGTVLLQTLPPPLAGWSGHADARLPGAPAAMIQRLNGRLADLAASHQAVLFDVAALAGRVGLDRWYDPRLTYRAKVPFNLTYLPLYADHVARLLRAVRGLSAKCLVLDLDNTCWGGVVGDDGLNGIRIGQGSAEGEAHLALQTYALHLKQRGIVLAVCSKNDEAIARQPFEHLPDMALRLDDIAVFVANWTDKATNLQRIATTLNIGVDALVFVDDNPAERARVRQMLPAVNVVELADDPADYVPLLAGSGYFETLTLTADDMQRADQYRANAARAAALETIGDYDAYLRSLAMECAVAPFDETGRARITQLINKTNQFNLTTRRYTEAEVTRMEQDPDTLTFQVRLKDTFGDNGMIAVLILRPFEDAYLCDTWLMSCRVLERRVEQAVLAVAVAALKEKGVARLYADYRPTAKNGLVRELLPSLGFAPVGPIEDDGTRYVLDLDRHVRPDLPMTLTLAPSLQSAWREAA